MVNIPPVQNPKPAGSAPGAHPHLSNKLFEVDSACQAGV